MANTNGTGSPGGTAKRNLFVVPGTVRLELDGDLEGYWVEAKAKLTFREREVLNGAILTSMPMGVGGSQYGVDVAKYNLLRLQTYLTEWNFTDARGKQLDLTRQNVENLDPEVADAVTAKLDDYLAGQAREGKASGTNSGSPPSAPSSLKPAGPTAS